MLKSYEDKSPESGNVLSRSFCGICGSNIRVTSRDHPGFAGVGVGIIDGDKTDLKPLYEVFCCRKVPWVQPVDGARVYPKLPPGGLNEQVSDNRE